MQSYRVENGDLVLLCGDLVLLCGLAKRRSPGQCSMRKTDDFEMAVIAWKKGRQEKVEVGSECSRTRCASADLGWVAVIGADHHHLLQLRYRHFHHLSQDQELYVRTILTFASLRVKPQTLGWGRTVKPGVERRKIFQRVLNPAVGWNWSSHHRSYHQGGNGHRASQKTGSQKRLQKKRWKVQWVSLIVFNHVVEGSPYMVSSSSFLDMTLARRCSWLLSREYTALPSETASSRAGKGFRMDCMSLMGACVTRCSVGALSSRRQVRTDILHIQVTDEIRGYKKFK